MTISFAGLKVDFQHISDAIEANALGYRDSYIDIYSNSWGPSDHGFVVEGPGALVQATFANGIAKVKESSVCIKGCILYTLHCRDGMGREVSMCGQLVMVVLISTRVQLMDMLTVYTLLLLVQLIRMDNKPTMMRTALLKWPSLSATTLILFQLYMIHGILTTKYTQPL